MQVMRSPASSVELFQNRFFVQACPPCFGSWMRKHFPACLSFLGILLWELWHRIIEIFTEYFKACRNAGTNLDELLGVVFLDKSMTSLIFPSVAVNWCRNRFLNKPGSRNFALLLWFRFLSLPRFVNRSFIWVISSTTTILFEFFCNKDASWMVRRLAGSFLLFWKWLLVSRQF